MDKYVINGRFLSESITGIQRYAYEVTRELDKLVDACNVDIFVPSDATADLTIYKNINTVRSDSPASQKWEQVDFARYLRKRRANGINLCNIVPLAQPQGIACIHDVSYKVNPGFFKGSRHARLSRKWHCLNYWMIARRTAKIVTVSEFSKQEIVENYHVDRSRITVVPDSWEHFNQTQPRKNLFSEKYPFLLSGEYFYSMCSLAKNKNLQWVVEVARRNPEETFVISGMFDPGRLGENVDFSNIPNVYHLGYTSDDEAKSLMQNCKAFLFPTLYEGFGIPPMEAMSMGANCVVSDIPVMHEIYGDAVSYINPYDYCLTWAPIPDSVRQECLAKFSWKRSAQLLYKAMLGSE